MTYHIGKIRRAVSVRWRILGIVIIIVVACASAATWFLRFRPAVLNIKAATSTATRSVDKPMPAAEAGLLPWQLPMALSRMAVYPGHAQNNLIVAGGLLATGQSINGIYTLNTTDGTLNQISSLPTPTHDAASAMVGSAYGLFGGGSGSVSNTSAVDFTTANTVNSSGNLPQPRSDADAVTVGNTTYIIGGYNGVQADDQVLTTTDGSNFAQFGLLPVAVRYPAAAALGNMIYVFGGEAVGGSQNGKPVNVVQIINTSTHSITKAPWTLPVPLEGAAAFTIDGELFLAGGLSSTPETIATGMGTTQVPGVTVTNSSLTYNTIWSVDTVAEKFLSAGRLQLPVSNSGVAVVGSRAWIVGGEYNSQPVSAVQMVTPNIAFGVAGQLGAGSPYSGGKLLVADRGNNRLLVMDASMHITWQYPSASTSTQVASSFYFPDDAFFANHGTEIVSNQEDNNTIVQISYPSGKIIWNYGHPKVTGTGTGYLNTPDDAYLLKDGTVVVSDDSNCRIVFISPQGSMTGQIGKTGVCGHNAGVSLGAPNGDTPLADGNFLVSEIWGSWVSEYTRSGNVVWTTKLPIAYPSDPQQITSGGISNPDNYLIADYDTPGAIVEFQRSGKILNMYQPTTGPGMLDHPSLVELLPSGVYMANDDHRDRMVAIDPTTKALVWQYGTNDQPGTSPGTLHKPDGFDVLMANGTTPTHPTTM